MNYSHIFYVTIIGMFIASVPAYGMEKEADAGSGISIYSDEFYDADSRPESEESFVIEEQTPIVTQPYVSKRRGDMTEQEYKKREKQSAIKSKKQPSRFGRSKGQPKGQ